MIDIISVHIPKTGGSSLFRILKQVYSRDYVYRLNTINLIGQARENVIPAEEIPGHTMVIHGHLKISQLKDIINRDEPKIITWLREPVERVISNYYHSMLRIRLGKADERKLGTADYSLIEYAEIEENRNKASFQLEGYKLNELFFVGLYEYLDEDFELLKDKMLWPDYLMMPHAKSGSRFKTKNDCKTQIEDITDDVRQHIAALNVRDSELYNEAKAFRKKL
ncbi:MAG: sulfotransferase family protein [Bacteroidales bacterium]|nr:sulfotransferase family protein [Bacteroidales bacterium]